MVLLPSITLPEEFHTLIVRDDQKIHFFSVYPVYKEEMDLKLAKGVKSLIEKFESAEVTDILDPSRPNTCKRRWWPF